MPQAAPRQYLFVSNRNVVVGSTFGHSIEFVRGVPTHVPRVMHALVLEKGIIRCDEKGNPLDESAAAETVAPGPGPKEAPEDPGEREEEILEAIKKIVDKNKSTDFSAGGVPLAAAVAAHTGWRVDQGEVRPVWNKFKPGLLARGK